MGIWKQCNLAESGSGERTNVCLMWDCPGHVIALFTRERLRGGYEKTSSNALSCGLKLGAFCLCVNVSLFFFLCLLLCFPPSLALDICLSVPLSFSYIHTHTHINQPPLPSSYVFVLLCLVSVREERVKGQGPLSPQGKARGSQSEQGSSQGAPRLLSAASATPIADVFSHPFRYVTCSMCSHTQTHKNKIVYAGLCCIALRCVTLCVTVYAPSQWQW